jgi:epoxyqueuosine reductase
MTASGVKKLAAECGFELCGVAPAATLPDAAIFAEWVAAGHAAGMRYLTDHRADLRRDPRSLLPSARSVVCVGKLYYTPHPAAPISRYAWGADYHKILRDGLEQLAGAMRAEAGEPFECKICVDTAPLLERSYANRAGLGWIGKNSCLIHEGAGSWFFLGELLVSLELEPDAPPPDRCGTCRRCIDACPTGAILPGRTVDSRLCIPYHNIESREGTPEPLREAFGGLLFGCDICQDVCPWNNGAPFTLEPGFQPRPDGGEPLESLASLSEDEFRRRFRDTPVYRAKYTGFLRNVALAMGNAARPEYRPVLENLAAHPDAIVAEQAHWSLQRLNPPRADGRPAVQD